MECIVNPLAPSAIRMQKRYCKAVESMVQVRTDENNVAQRCIFQHFPVRLADKKPCTSSVDCLIRHQILGDRIV